MESRLELSRRELTERAAYHYWEVRGRPPGSPQEDWTKAEEAVDIFLKAFNWALDHWGERWVTPDEGPSR